MTNEDKTSASHAHKDKTPVVKRLQSHSQLDSLSVQKPQSPRTLHRPNTASNSEQGSEEGLTWRLKLQSSSAFEKIMVDIEGKMVEQFKKQQELTKKASENDIVVEKPVILLELDEEDDEEEEAMRLELEKAKNSPLRIKARRAWALIRRHIREEAMNKKQNKSTFQWSMLKQTIKNMTNMDAARGEMYNKYLNPTNPRPWAEGIKSIPPGFFAKHSKELARKSAPSTRSIGKQRLKSAATQKTRRSTQSYNV